jgi:hypothetical protein
MDPRHPSSMEDAYALMGLDLGPLLALGGAGDLSLPQGPPISAVARGSGLSSESTSKAEQESEQKAIEKRATILEGAQWDELTGRVRAMPEFQDRAQGVRNLEALQDQYAAMPMQLDLSPLMALADTWTGSKLADSYRKPQSEQERLGALLGFERAAQEGRESASDFLIKSLEPQMTGETLAQQILSATQGIQQGAAAEDPRKFERSTGLKPYDVDKAVERHEKNVRPIQDTYARLEYALEAVKPYLGKKDIPGIGAWDSRKPDFMASPDEVKIRQSRQDVLNELNRLTSGATVTPQESQRLKAAMGNTFTGGEREYVEGMARIGRVLREIMAGREAAFKGRRPEVIDAFGRGGGTTSDRMNAEQGFAEGRKDKGGMTPEQRKRLQDLRKKYGSGG